MKIANQDTLQYIRSLPENLTLFQLYSVLHHAKLSGYLTKTTTYLEGLALHIYRLERHRTTRPSCTTGPLGVTQQPDFGLCRALGAKCDV